ncbi:MAG: helix-turn-helix transcriptional regulator [Pseudohongiellaceae bacterium]
MRSTRVKESPSVVETAHPFEGLIDGDARMAKAVLAERINNKITKYGLNQTEAAALLGITQPEVSKLGKGSLSGFTFDRLYRCLNALDMEVVISVKEHLKVSEKAPGVYVAGSSNRK